MDKNIKRWKKRKKDAQKSAEENQGLDISYLYTHGGGGGGGGGRRAKTNGEFKSTKKRGQSSNRKTRFELLYKCPQSIKCERKIHITLSVFLGINKDRLEGSKLPTPLHYC